MKQHTHAKTHSTQDSAENCNVNMMHAQECNAKEIHCLQNLFSISGYFIKFKEWASEGGETTKG